MKKYCIIGKDDRSTWLKKLLLEEGKNIVDCNSADVVIAPIPFSRDGINLTGEDISVDEFIKVVKNKLLFTGAVLPNLKEKLKDVKYYDLMELDEVAVLNAIPTAEGAIYEAIKNSNITLSGSNSLILGYGRIGKVLASMLKGINSRVYCEARSKKDIAYIEALGYNSVYIDELSSYLPKMDYIFNTIPYTIIDEKNIKYINKECTIIDLASAPGGIDFELAKKLGLNVIWALALPSKVAPKSAAKYLKDTIDNILLKEKRIDS